MQKDRWWVAKNRLRKVARQHGPTQDGRTPCRWCEWLEHMRKNDEKGKMEEMHQRKVEEDDSRVQKAVFSTKSRSQQCGEEECRY